MKSISATNPAIMEIWNIWLLRQVPQLSIELVGVSLDRYTSFPATSNTLGNIPS